MAVNLSPVFGAAGQLFDNNGNPLAGGKIFTYLAGTTTNAATYTTNIGDIAHTNPIILDGAGRVPSGEIWLTNAILYKFVVTDSANSLIGTYDNLAGINNNNLTVQNFSGNGSTTIFTLGSAPQNENATFIYINGVYQQKNTYLVSGTTLTFSAAPPNFSTIEVVY
jgi:hypothetical protein